MSYAAVDQDETEDRYHTQIEAGDVRLFTLDQLDAAFNAGLIHENTYVCLEGGSDWLTLGEVAGLGDEEPESAPVSAAVPIPQSRQLTAAPTYGGYAASPSVIPAAPYSVAPMVMPRSIAPVTNDLSFDDDFEMMAMRPKRRAGKVVAGLAVLALGGLGFAVVQSGGIKLPKLNLDQNVSQATAASLTLSSLKDTHATPTPPAPAPVAEAAKPEPPKAEEPKAADAAPASDAAKTDADSSAKKGDDRFSEEMKAALLNKDKKQSTTQKQKKTARTAVAAKQAKAGKPGKSSTGFKTGGSAYDPLNGKL
jgi:pyruvate/2-oxoglutarate dehydrogenase complex dihydrolipoamide acyltransferase (E2) component